MPQRPWTRLCRSHEHLVNGEAREQPADDAGSGATEILELLLTRHLEDSGAYQGRFSAWLGSEPILPHSRQPLLDGARALLERGHDPSTLLTIRHKSSAHASFGPEPIGELAQWTYDESDRDGPRRRRWRSSAPLGGQDKGAGATSPGSADSGQPDADVAREEGDTRAA